jgi:hypothetical protein
VNGVNTGLGGGISRAMTGTASKYEQREWRSEDFLKRCRNRSKL